MSSCCSNHLPLPSKAQHSCHTHTKYSFVRLCRAQTFPYYSHRANTVFPVWPHLLKLVDLADEEVPIAPSNLCVCDVDHVLGKEEQEVRKRTVLAGSSRHCRTGGAMKGARLQPQLSTAHTPDLC